MVAPTESLDLTSARDVSRLLIEMFGSNLAWDRGVIHVAAVAAASGANQVLKITPQTPRCLHDSFVLNVSRALANCIVTTGRILRDEPDLTHHFVGSEQTRRALVAWRHDVVGIRQPASVLVLTSGRKLDARHPVFSGPGPVTIYTSIDGANALRKNSFRGAEIVSVGDPDIRNVIDFAVRERGAATVSIEAGASTTSGLYEPPIRVEQLLLSIFHGTVAPALLGGSFVSDGMLNRSFRRLASFQVPSREGPWSFHRFVI